MANTNKKKVNARKWINWILISFAIVLACLISSKLYKIYKNNQLSESVLSREIGAVQLNDIDNSINELASDGFVLISYLKDKDVRNLESSLKKIILKNNLQSNFLYFDATDLMLEDNYINAINKTFSLNKNNQITSLPAILYYKDGELVKTLSSTKTKLLTSDDFLKLLYEYEVIKD